METIEELRAKILKTEERLSQAEAENDFDRRTRLEIILQSQEQQLTSSLSHATQSPSASGDWNVNASPIRVLGDNISGPHSTAIIVGSKTIVACAHSLDLLIDDSHRNTKSNTHYKYLEDYWIQPQFTRNIRGEVTDDNRIPIKLFKFNVDSDWALFVRADDALFEASEIATIDTSPLDHPHRILPFEKTAVLHCPVSLKSGITRAEEFTVGCQTAFVHLQAQSTHHVKYEGRDLCRGSSGGGVYVFPSTSVLGIHLEAINEADYDAEDAAKTIAHSDKRVGSEDEPYKRFDSSDPPKKKLKNDSETIASVAGGNNGLGSALIICKFSRLMHYIRALEA